ncbi:hypothetical protein L614_001300001220 [Ochrobactrum sp. J50]|uniref:gp53-like domain-containing protein n=1 Tax=Ochrobactrum sp. J50 TaxID=936132 RepID=UPI0011AD49B1|nr:hypothetical protein [Ochrobactrum sp. J50]TWH03353.1 hypothetical protein L614_001300001220 [Ochrobactrum sp. J50]
MAIRPDYQTGTIDLVASSADFTTTGAALQMVAVQPGDAIITPSGHVLIIATITGQNSGTLFLPCPPAAAGTGLPLRIRFQPDGSRYQGAVRNLIDLLSSGNLEDFAALVGADGMVPIFTGPGTLDLADPATFGIQDPNGSLGKLAALTLAARQILQTDAAGALKALALDANKFLRTDANADITLSDITAAAIALLNLSGTAAADQLPYLTGASGAGLTALTSFARTILDDANGAAMFTTMGAISGTNWRKLPNGLLFQWGSTQVTTDASGNAVLTFPTAFTANDSFQVTAWNDNKDAWGATLLSQYRSSSPWPKSTGFVVGCWNTLTGAALASQSIRIGWQAFGI